MKTLLNLLVFLIIASSCQTEDGKMDESKPNIVLIISDDQAWTDYSFMGHNTIKTPHIDKLAREGHTFQRAYVPTSLCSPSLASIATGLYPKRHNVLGNDRILPTDAPKDRKKVRAQNYLPVIDSFKELNTLPKMLHDHGYLSFQTGKWWIGNHKNGGFDDGMTHGDTARGGRHGDVGLEIGRKGLQPINDYIDLSMKEEKPFFLWYAPFLPHAPHTPPDSLLEKYIDKTESAYIAKYWAMCEWFDHTVGDLVKLVDDKGQTENTLYVYVCDNGWVQNEDNGKYNPISKRAPFDYGMRTPIIFNWKGKTTAFMDETSIASSVDIIPTILSLLEIEIPQGLDGIDILNTTKLNEREVVFGEIYKHDFHQIEDSHLNDIAISNPYKLIVPNPKNNPDGQSYLFNIIEDPFEKENLIDKLPSVATELDQKIKDSWLQK